MTMTRQPPATERRGLRVLAALALLLLLLPCGRSSSFGDDRPAITIRLRDAPARFVVEGLPAETLDRIDLDASTYDDLFTVRVEGSKTPMLGRLSVAGDALRFEPRFPPKPGVRYRAALRLDRLPGAEPKAPVIETLLELPKPEPREPGRVDAVFPSTERPPENLLRFYLHFSAPMSRGEAYRRIRLLDAEGRPVPAPFLELDEELWDSSGTRLTLLIDPGRIKRGLVPRQELGPVLEAGRRYTLVIDENWPDARGRPLESGSETTFRAGPEDNDPPDPKRWRIEAPRGGSTEPLTVLFPEPLDRALAARLIDVRDERDTPILGRVSLDREETRWRFVPEAAWKPGAYRLVVGVDLEDLAGNAVGRPFEVDVFERVTPEIEHRSVSIPFRVE